MSQRTAFPSSSFYYQIYLCYDSIESDIYPGQLFFDYYTTVITAAIHALDDGSGLISFKSTPGYKEICIVGGRNNEAAFIAIIISYLS